MSLDYKFKLNNFTTSPKKSFGFGLAIEFILTTGTRLGEASALTWGDLKEHATNTHEKLVECVINKTRHYKDRCIQNKAKSGSNRLCIIPHNLAEKLCLWKQQLTKLGYQTTNSDAAFPNIAKNQMGFSGRIGFISKKIGIRHTTAHCLRHSFVTFLAKYGHNLQEVQKAAGHSTLTTTRSYFNASSLGLEPMARTMERILRPTEKLGATDGLIPKPETYSIV